MNVLSSRTADPPSVHDTYPHACPPQSRQVGLPSHAVTEPWQPTRVIVHGLVRWAGKWKKEHSEPHTRPQTLSQGHAKPNIRLSMAVPSFYRLAHRHRCTGNWWWPLLQQIQLWHTNFDLLNLWPPTTERYLLLPMHMHMVHGFQQHSPELNRGMRLQPMPMLEE